jgi:solute:Na+ symporter, SSS family
MLITVGITTAVWLTVTFLTDPEPDAVLDRFYRKVRPGGFGWRPVAQRLGFGDDRIPGGALSWVNWVAGVIAVFTALFGVGEFLTGSTRKGALYSLAAIGAFALIMRNLRGDTQLATSVDRSRAAGLGFSQSN